MPRILRSASRIAVLLLPIALGACAQYGGVMNTSASTGPAAFAWDGAGEDPNLPQPARRARAVSQATEPADTAQASSDPDTDRALARKLVICNGCINQPQVADRPDESRLASR